jgi:hypothetical protein
MNKPKFNPDKAFQVVDEAKTVQAAPKPKFNKNKPFSDYIVDSLTAQDELEQEQLDRAPDLALLAAQGASQDFLDEGAGVVSSALNRTPYKEERDKFRAKLQGARDRTGIAGDVAELGGNVAITMIPGMKMSSTVGKELGLAAIQGAGAAKEMEDIPLQATKSVAISGAAQAVGKGVNKMLFDQPDKILARTMGANRKSFFDGKNTPKDPEKVAKRLDDLGLYRQGEVVFNEKTKKFVPNAAQGRLESFFKPQTLEDISARATTAVSTLKRQNEKLLANKKIPMAEVVRATQQAAFDFIPDGFDVMKRTAVANSVADKIIMDLELKGKVKGVFVQALDVEDIKRQLQQEVFNTFNKSADDLAMTPEAQRKFSTKLDDLVDSYGGPEYKSNNDLMSDLLSQNDNLEKKIITESAVGVEKPSITRGNLWDRAVDMVNPPSIGVGRARIGKNMDGLPLEVVRKGFKRAPVEMLNNNIQVIENDPGHPMQKGRMPQSIPNIPEQFIRTPLPRTTEGLMKNKKFVLGKVAQMAPEMFEAVSDVMENNPEELPALAQVLSQKAPHFFAKDKYNRFDGRIISEKDKQMAIKDTLLNDSLSTIEQAKIITKLNKEGLYDG